VKGKRWAALAVFAMVVALLPLSAVTAVATDGGVCDLPYTPIYDIQGSGFASPLLPAPIQFLSYEGTFTASGGVADGMVSEDIGVSEPYYTPVGYSLQLSGTGSTYGDFTWQSAAPATFGAVNTGQTFSGSGDKPFINEIHYDNTGTDTGEAIEVAGPAGFDLDGWTIVLYNGYNGTTYGTGHLSGTIPDLQNGFGVVVVDFPTNGIQNGSPDGLALVSSDLVTTMGVVTADFQKSSELSGFFVQDLSGDKDPSTSDGVFVYHRDYWGYDVSVGDVVRFTAEVSEYSGLTELSNVADLTVCGTGSVNPTKVFLPVSSMADWESVEGMLVDMPQKLYVSGNYDQGHYGEIDLSFNWPLDNPTNVVWPGSQAVALQEANDLDRIQLDDASGYSNPSWLPYFYDIPGYRTLRTGDTTKQKVTGVIGYAYGDYELHPTVPVEFQPKNPRPDSAPNVGGSLQVAAFNVLNYFTTIDHGSPICGPLGDQDCRGADSDYEFGRQKAKIVAAISKMDADVVGLMEIENYPGDVPTADLVSGLNDATAAGTYDYIATGAIGSDAIRVALIYKPGTVEPVGDFAILDSSVDPTFNDEKNRPALAQTFRELATGEEFTVAVNHLKSKGSDCDSLGDPDTGDGQGNCNLTRLSAAEALVNWLMSDPTDSGDPDFLITGDLNSYAMEDPITAIKAMGYLDLIDEFNGEGWKGGAYSYNYYSQSGYLDQALANAGLASQVSGAAFWHINADEPSALDYNSYNQSQLYQPDEFRSSDHDPVLVGLNLGKTTSRTK
jgi:hypothetical protein